jgi:hypothetical protein
LVTWELSSKMSKSCSKVIHWFLQLDISYSFI